MTVADLVSKRWAATAGRPGRLLRFRRAWRSDEWERDWPLVATALESLLRDEGPP